MTRNYAAGLDLKMKSQTNWTRKKNFEIDCEFLTPSNFIPFDSLPTELWSSLSRMEFNGKEEDQSALKWDVDPPKGHFNEEDKRT